MEFSLEETVGFASSGNLHLAGNPLQHPEPEIIQQGKAAVRNWFQQVAVQGTETLYEGKILLVGEPDAGKTTLMRKMFDEGIKIPDEDQNSTLGVSVQPGLNVNGSAGGAPISMSANVWDFGGQEIQYMLHQYFLTPDSLYVLVCDDRQENTRFDYWFQIIRLLGTESSPILVMLNKIKFESVSTFKRDHYRERFPGLRIDEVEVDLSKNDQRWQRLKDMIAERLSDLSVVGREVPRLWKTIRAKIEELKSRKLRMISLQEFLVLCADQGLEQEADVLNMLAYFHRIGIVLHFAGDERLSKTIFLDPNWITTSLYAILSDKNLGADRGQFNRDWIFSFWKEKGYGEIECGDLLSLMRKDNFDICYQLPGDQEQFIVPMLLPRDIGKYEWNTEENLQFRFQYPFMPRGIISRLIVRLNEYIEGKLKARSGAVFFHKPTQVRAEVLEEVTADEGLKVISIRISQGNLNDRREFLSRIRAEIEFIHTAAFPGMRCSEMVICNCPACLSAKKPNFHKRETLDQYIARGKTEIECHASSEKASIISMIGGVYGEHALKEGKYSDRAVKNKESKTSVSRSLSRVRELDKSIQRKKLEIEKLKALKATLDEKAEKQAARIEWFFAGISLFVFTGWALTVYLWGWDTIEPISFLTPLALVALSNFLFARFGRKWTRAYMLRTRLERISKEVYATARFSPNELDLTESELRDLEHEKRRVLESG